MRINAEKQRLKKYQDITNTSANLYYNILKRISQEQESFKKETTSFSRDSSDPQAQIQLAVKEAKLQSLMNYITGKYSQAYFLIPSFFFQTS